MSVYTKNQNTTSWSSKLDFTTTLHDAISDLILFVFPVI